MSFFVGQFDFDSLQVGAVWMRFATYPAGSVAASTRLSRARCMVVTSLGNLRVDHAGREWRAVRPRGAEVDGAAVRGRVDAVGRERRGSYL